MNPETSKAMLPHWLRITLISIAAISLLLTFLLVIGIAVLRSSPARLEVVLEEVISRILDRELVIGELLEADLNWDSYLLARDVSLANPEWAEERDFARVGRLLLRINLPSIWQDGPILIHQLELDDARVTVLAPEDHAPNWDFWPDKTTEDAQEVEANAGKKITPVFPLEISDGRIDKGELVYRDPDQDVLLLIDELTLREPRDGTLVNLDLAGIINEIPLQVKGRLGPAAALLTRRDLSMDIVVKLGQLVLEGRGSIDDLVNFSGPDLQLKISAPHSRPLLDILGMTEVRDGPLHFEGHIGDAHPGMAVDAVGSLGEFDLRLLGSLVRPLQLDGVDMAFDFSGPSLTELGAMFEIAGLPELSYKVSGDVYRHGTVLGVRGGQIEAGKGHMNIEGRLPDFPGIDDWELTVGGKGFNLALWGPVLGIEGLPEIPYDIDGNLGSTDEGVELVNLSIRHPESSVLLSGVVGEAPDYLDSRIRVEHSGNDLAYSGLWLGIQDLPNLAFQVSGELSYSDDGWHLSDGVFSTTDLQLALNAQVDKLPEPTSVDASVRLDSPNLEATLKVFGFEQEGLPVFPVVVNAVVNGPPDMLRIDEATIASDESQVKVSGTLGDPATLAELDLVVQLSTPDLLKLISDVDDDTHPQLPVNTRSHITMSPEGIGIEEFQGEFGGATVALKGLFNIEPPHNNSQFTLRTDGPDLGRVLGPWLEQEIASTPYQLSLDAKFESGGVEVKQLEATAVGAQLSAKFAIDKLDDPASAHGNIQLSGSSSQRLAELLGVESVIPDSNYSLNIGIQNTPDWLRLNPISLDWGGSDYRGSVDFKPGDIPTIHVDMRSKYLSLPFLLPNLKELEEDDTARAAAGDVFDESVLTEKLSTNELAERVIPDEPFDFGWLRKLQTSVKYQVDEIYINENTTSSAMIDLSIADGAFTSHQFHWEGEFIRGDADISIQALEAGAEIDIYLDMQRIPLLLMLGGEPRYQADSFYRGRIKASGNSFRELARSANGALVFSGGGGRLDNNGLDLILGDVLEEVLDRLNPFSDTDPYTEVICHAGAMSVKDGKVAVAPGLVIRSKKTDIASGGKVDLHRERLDLAFNTRSRKGVGISASKAITPYFKIGGTLANPRLELDPKGVAISGGAAVATAGLSILAEGLWDRWVATAKNPCERLITELSKKEKRVFKTLLEAS